MKCGLYSFCATLGALVLTSHFASAHITIAGPAYAKGSFTGAFSVAHGCENAAGTGMYDTSSVTIDVPSSITSIRAVDSTLGKAVVTMSGTTVTHITWSKNQSDILSNDVDFYTLPVKMTMPDAAWTTVYFFAHQDCMDTQGHTAHVDWVGLAGQTTALPDGAPPPEPAPNLFLLPARTPGWNKFTVTQHLTSLTMFNDAEIVWAGNAAYSVNPNYTALIGMEPNTTALTDIPAGTDIWVKY